MASTLGQTGNPFESWLALRGLATLGLRMARACATALELARRFESHPRVARVYYPLLASHPDFELASRLLPAGGGTIVTIDLVTRERADAFIRALAGSIPFAPSLGDVQTTLSHPATTSHRGQDAGRAGSPGHHAGHGPRSRWASRNPGPLARSPPSMGRSEDGPSSRPWRSVRRRAQCAPDLAGYRPRGTSSWIRPSKARM